MPSSIIVAFEVESFVPRANRSIRAKPPVHVGEVHIGGGAVRGGVFGEDDVGGVDGKIRIVPGRRWGRGVGGAVKRVGTPAGRRERYGTGREGEREGGGEEKEERGWEPLEAEKRLCGVPDLKHRTKRREGGI